MIRRVPLLLVMLLAAAPLAHAQVSTTTKLVSSPPYLLVFSYTGSISGSLLVGLSAVRADFLSGGSSTYGPITGNDLDRTDGYIGGFAYYDGSGPKDSAAAARVCEDVLPSAVASSNYARVDYADNSNNANLEWCPSNTGGNCGYARSYPSWVLEQADSDKPKPSGTSGHWQNLTCTTAQTPGQTLSASAYSLSAPGNATLQYNDAVSPTKELTSSVTYLVGYPPIELQEPGGEICALNSGSTVPSCTAPYLLAPFIIPYGGGARFGYGSCSSNLGIASSCISASTGEETACAPTYPPQCMTQLLPAPASCTGALSGARNVSIPSGISYYNYTCVNINGTTTLTAKITAAAAPNPVATLSATSPVSYAAASTLTYTCANSTSGSIDHGVGNITVDGKQHTVNSPDLTAKTTFTLTCKNAGGDTDTDTASVTVSAAPQPDLVISSFNPPTDPVAGESAKFSVNVKNQGTADTVSGFTDTLYLCKGAANCSMPAKLNASNYALAKGKDTTSQPITFSYSFPSSGAWYLQVCADTPPPNGAIAESNENNNCLKSGAYASGWQSVTVNNPPDPIASLKILSSPLPIPYQATANLQYSCKNSTTANLTDSGSWDPPIGTSGTITSPSLSAKDAFTLTCINSVGANATDQKTVTVLPFARLSADNISIPYDSAVTFTYACSNATSATLTNYSGSWHPNIGTNGSIKSSNLTSSDTFVLTCKNADGSNPDSDPHTVSVAVAPAPKPTGTLTVSPDRIQADSGTPVHIYWSGENVASCTLTSDTTGINTTKTAVAGTVAGQDTSDTVNDVTIYTLDCPSLYPSLYADFVTTATINVTPNFTEF